MPITLHPISRRRFLAGSLAAGAALALRRYAPAAQKAVDANHFVLFSDTHIDADPTKVDRGVTMFDHLRQSVAEVLDMSSAPAAVLVNGDCAHLQGRTADYEQFLNLLKPLREAGLPIHANFGNHDDREHFWGAVPADEQRAKAVEDRQIVVLQSPRADWIMLDSLQKTNSTPGELGEKQLHWLSEELDRRKDRRVIVMVHHQPDEREKISGLLDTKPLLDVLLGRKQVKALLYGHTHIWRVEKRDNLHCINLPAVSYNFGANEPTGWVDAHLSETAMTLKLNCIDPKHPQNGDSHELKWR
jgi:3',5'-cyclic-AMP phosphodiesterase